MKLAVEYTPIRVTITNRYPFVKPSIVFLDRDIKAQGIAPSGLYTDNIAWSPHMDISDFVDCVRHELLTAPCVHRVPTRARKTKRTNARAKTMTNRAMS